MIQLRPWEATHCGKTGVIRPDILARFCQVALLKIGLGRGIKTVQ